MLAPRGRGDAFVAEMRNAVAAMYPTIAQNPDYTSIVSDRHYQRLANLVADATTQGATRIPLVDVAQGPESARKFTPTMPGGADDGMAVMQQEIFGPVLPVIAYDTLDEAIDYVNRHPRPLPLSWFGEGREERHRALHNTISHR